MNDGWREDFKGFEDDPDGFQKAVSGLIVFSPLFALAYLVVAVLAAL